MQMLHAFTSTLMRESAQKHEEIFVLILKPIYHIDVNTSMTDRVLTKTAVSENADCKQQKMASP